MKEGICRRCQHEEDVFDDNGLCYTCWKADIGLEHNTCITCGVLTWIHQVDHRCSLCRPEPKFKLYN